MSRLLKIHNSLSREKETFLPQRDGFVGMYVCGPTVYSDVHLGNCRTFVSFDIIYRFLLFLGYKVRYVRNITDVGHLLDDGEDRILKGARLMQLEPMEVVQKYTLGFHDILRLFNTLPPSIEPRATQHIIEQIELVKTILQNGYAYERNGSVYFDTAKLVKNTDVYGQLSGRVVEDLLAETRDDLKNQSEKKNPADFAIWIKASEDHIMKWPSPWSLGFPGWHLECSAMSTKYLGNQFDIHGGGNDLKFPHHENEIAQNYGACSCTPARYWLHTNMLLMNGRKMSKSDGNTITPQQLFSGDSEHISKAYSPMVVKFFMLQSHYRSTLDMSDDALLASEKGFNKLIESIKKLTSLAGSATQPTSLDKEILSMLDQLVVEMLDDFNTPKAIAVLFELASKINSLDQNLLPPNQISKSTLEAMQLQIPDFMSNVLGLAADATQQLNNGSGPLEGAMDILLDLRKQARHDKNWGLSDQIRDRLLEAGIVLKDGADKTDWTLE